MVGFIKKYHDIKRIACFNKGHFMAISRGKRLVFLRIKHVMIIEKKVIIQ